MIVWCWIDQMWTCISYFSPRSEGIRTIWCGRLEVSSLCPSLPLLWEILTSSLFCQIPKTLIHGEKLSCASGIPLRTDSSPLMFHMTAQRNRVRRKWTWRLNTFYCSSHSVNWPIHLGVCGSDSSISSETPTVKPEVTGTTLNHPSTVPLMTALNKVNHPVGIFHMSMCGGITPPPHLKPAVPSSNKHLHG